MNNNLRNQHTQRAFQMASRERCPRCGYVLRYDTLSYVCDFCGLQGKRSLTSMIISLERELKGRVENFLQTHTYTYSPRNVTEFQSCRFCGFNFPPGSQQCPECGKTTNNLTPFEEQVFEYISSHNGTISLSQAAQDLSVSLEILGQAIERLKATGTLKQT